MAGRARTWRFVAALVAALGIVALWVALPRSKLAQIASTPPGVREQARDALEAEPAADSRSVVETDSASPQTPAPKELEPAAIAPAKLAEVVGTLLESETRRPLADVELAFVDRRRFRDAIYFYLGGLDLYPRPTSPTHTTS